MDLPSLGDHHLPGALIKINGEGPVDPPAPGTATSPGLYRKVMRRASLAPWAPGTTTCLGPVVSRGAHHGTLCMLPPS